MVVEALADVDVEVVVAAVESQRELFGTLPANVRHAGRVPLHQLLRTSSALVQQGGAGCTMTALANGVPQVVVPQIADQPYWAGRVQDLGIGAAHDGPTPTAESLAAALEHTLNPATRERARAVAGTIRSDGATRAANLLLEEGPSSH